MMALQQARTQPIGQSILLNEMTQVIARTIAPEKIILFGSRARGTASSYSDYDFLIIESQPFVRGRRRLERATKVAWALSHFDVSTDILFFSIDEVEYWSQSPNHVVSCALREGQVLYERPTAS